MKSSHWNHAVERCADPQRARDFFDQLAATGALSRLKGMSAEQSEILAALFSGSQSLSAALVNEPGWLDLLTPESLAHPRRAQGLRREVNDWLEPLLESGDDDAALARVRRFKQQQMLRVGARDLARLGPLPEIIQELSDVADVCLDAVWRICWRQMTARFGTPYHQDPEGRWRPTPFCVFGMGKHGGQELNYSSDVDVLFAYEEEGHVFKTPPARNAQAGRGMTSHQFFTRCAESFIAEVSRRTPDGALYRIDLRLRPEGDAGPLVRSLASYENYYAQWGQTWERMMLIKARCVAGDATLAGEFLEMIQPFRYPRSIGERILREVATVKARIETEVVRAGEIDRNVKLGRGGIREIEFVAQSLQVLHAGRQPFLQGARTLPALEKLVQYDLLKEGDADRLKAAYCFLRDVEHRLQMENDLQTHTIPTSRQARERLAALMGFEALGAFEAALKKHTGSVREIYDATLRLDSGEAQAALPRDFDGVEDEWMMLLAGHGFKDPEKAFRMIREFATGPGYVHVSPRTVDLARQLIPKILALCPKTGPAAQHETRKGKSRPSKPAASREQAADVLSDPDRVLTRLDSFIGAYGSRAMLFETWASNPALFDLLLQLFDRSEFLAETAIRVPDLVDELVLSGRLRQTKGSEETLKDLLYGLEDKDQHLWLRRYHQAEFMRIGLRHILGLADDAQVLVELSALADACLRYALEVVLHRRKLKKSPLAVIGLGKLGGAEIVYGSDLDIVFVTDAKASALPKLQPLAVEVMDLLSARTELGVVFEADARLRPDGEKGLLVNTLTAYEEYYRQRAMLWEIQSLSRCRAVAGDMSLGRRFEDMAGRLTNFKEPDLPLSAHTSDWKREIARMRGRIEKERTPAGKDGLAIKTGAGGLMDAEFIAQTFCLESGAREPNTLRALEAAREAGWLSKKDAGRLIDNYRHLRRLEGILRRWSYEGETVLPDDPAPYYRVAVRCGYPGSDEFQEALAGWRKAIRDVYQKVFPSG